MSYSIEHSLIKGIVFPLSDRDKIIQDIYNYINSNRYSIVARKCADYFKMSPYDIRLDDVNDFLYDSSFLTETNDCIYLGYRYYTMDEETPTGGNELSTLTVFILPEPIFHTILNVYPDRVIHDYLVTWVL
jgi:hypothetical protein